MVLLLCIILLMMDAYFVRGHLIPHKSWAHRRNQFRPQTIAFNGPVTDAKVH